MASLLGLSQDKVRVIAPAVGGGFGAKSIPEAEYVIACVLAWQLNRPVRWRQTRTENMLAVHGRGQRQRVRMAATRDGILTAIHADLLGDGGAYPAVNAYLVTLTGRMLAGVYAVPRASSSAIAVATNTAPPTAYRGAGRPEAACLVERAIDLVAAELGIDPIEIRRRNFIAKDQFPYTTPTGALYDVGDYDAALDCVLALSKYDERRREQAERRARDDRRLLGIGVAVYVEVTAGAGPSEFADVEVEPDGKITVKVGTFSHGQGHKTTYAQIASDALGVPFADITVINGDTAKVARGVGTYSSRSVQVGGTAIHVACGQVVEKAKLLAADILEAAAADIVHDADGFTVAGVPSQRITWAQAASHAQAKSTDDRGRGGLFVEIDWERPDATFPFGAHVAVVEIDRETGQVTLIDHTAVDDCGTIINPLLADGQVHGGIARGAAQALLEEVVFDDFGNLLTSNLADYASRQRGRVAVVQLDHTETPTHINPLGAKGIGESGTIGSTRPCTTRCSTPSGISACITSTCRAPRRRCGVRSTARATTGASRCGAANSFARDLAQHGCASEDEEQLLIGRKRPKIIGDQALELVGPPHRGHRREQRSARWCHDRLESGLGSRWCMTAFVKTFWPKISPGGSCSGRTRQVRQNAGRRALLRS